MIPVTQQLGVLLFLNPEGCDTKYLQTKLKLSSAELQTTLTKLEALVLPLGLTLLHTSKSVQLVASGSVLETIDEPVQLEQLSSVVLEVLTIIAYRQPITKTEIEELRGIGSDQSIKKLLEYGLIEKTKRKKAGITYLYYNTSLRFLEIFGISTLADLPPLSKA